MVETRHRDQHIRSVRSVTVLRMNWTGALAGHASVVPPTAASMSRHTAGYAFNDGGLDLGAKARNRRPLPARGLRGFLSSGMILLGLDRARVPRAISRVESKQR